MTIKKVLLPAAAVALLPFAVRAQVGIGTTSPNSKAALEISATTRGLLIPRLTETQRLAITSPPQGLMVYQTDGTASGGTQTGFWYYAGTPATWVYLNPAATGDNLGNHSATQDVALNGNDLKLNASSDDNNKLTYDATTVGLVLMSATGGVLGYRSSGTTTPVLQWANVSGNGRVGIGLAAGTTPSRSFDVGGGVRLRVLATAGYVTTDASGVLGSVAIPADQALSISGQTLSISGNPGNSVTLPSGGGSPSGTAGGDLTGTYPNPTVATGAIGTTKLADDAVTSAKVAAGAIGTTELANGAVTQPKLSATGTMNSTTYLRGDYTWATFPASTGWSLSGNTLDGNQFIGSTNDQDFVVKRNNTEAFRLKANGGLTLGNNTVGSSSVLLGFNAGFKLNTVSGDNTHTQNTFIGAKAGENNNADQSTLIGYRAGTAATGYSNTIVGASAGTNITGGSNVVIGAGSGTVGTGDYNIVLGSSSGTSMTSNSNNILIGSSTQAGAGLYNAYAIGNGATVTQGNSLVVGSAPGTPGAVFVGIGTSAPTSSLQVNGTFAVGVINGYGGGPNASNANSLDQGAVSATNITGGYYGLSPTSSSNQYYKLPAASACPGRIYYLRNNSTSTNAIISTDGGSIYAGGGTSPLSSYTLNASGSVKTVIAISDGTNWTLGKLD